MTATRNRVTKTEDQARRAQIIWWMLHGACCVYGDVGAKKVLEVDFDVPTSIEWYLPWGYGQSCADDKKYYCRLHNWKYTPMQIANHRLKFGTMVGWIQLSTPLTALPPSSSDWNMNFTFHAIPKWCADRCHAGSGRPTDGHSRSVPTWSFLLPPEFITATVCRCKSFGCFRNYRIPRMPLWW